MLQKLSDHIATAVARAAEAEELARQETDEAAKARHLQMAEAWRHVAGSFEFVIKLEEFLLDALAGNGGEGRLQGNHILRRCELK